MTMIKCEMCGGTDLIKQDGVFVCQNCGMKYSPEEAKKMMVEVAGTVAVKGSVKVENAVSAESLLKRAFMAMEDGELKKANEFFDGALNISPECAEAYLGKLLLEYKVSKEADLAKLKEPFDSSKNYQKIMNFGSPELCARIKEINDDITKEKIERDAKHAKMILKNSVREMRIPIAAGQLHTVALTSGGMVFATGKNDYGQCNVSEWRNIIAIATGSSHTVGLRSDGTVVATGENDEGQCNVSDWRDIIAIAAGSWHTVGLKSNGEVVAVGSNEVEQCNVSEWKNIVAIYAGCFTTVGIKSNGEVISTDDISLEYNDLKSVSIGSAMVYSRFSGDVGHCFTCTSGWSVPYHAEDLMYRGDDNTGDYDIIQVSNGDDYVVGLRADGTVVANVGRCTYYPGSDLKASDVACNVSEWKNIIAISAGDDHTVGLTKNMTVVATGKNDYGECNVSEWKDIMPLSTAETFEEDRQQKMKIINENYARTEELLRQEMARLEEERKEAARKAEEERKEAARKAEEKRIADRDAAEKRKKHNIIGILAACAYVIAMIIYFIKYLF